MGRGNESTHASAAAQLRGVRADITSLSVSDLRTDLAAFNSIRNVNVIADGVYEVTFERTDGTVSTIIADANEVKATGDVTDRELVSAALYQAVLRQALNSDDPALEKLGDAASLLLSDQGISDETLAQIQDAARSELSSRSDQVSLEATSSEREKNVTIAQSPRALEREALERFGTSITKIKQAVPQASDPELVLRAMSSQGADFDPTAPGVIITREIGEQASEELGALIPTSGIAYETVAVLDDDGNPVNDENGDPKMKIESTGPYEMDKDVFDKVSVFVSALEIGDRSFALRGEPGSGKDQFALEMAAMTNRPVVKINFGPTSDLESNIGGDGLSHKVVSTKQEVVSPSGEKVEVESESVVTVSSAVYGPLTAAKYPIALVLDEVEGFELDFVRMHSALGDNIGQPETRYLSINATAAGAEGVTIPLHKDSVIFVTYNSNADHEVKFKQATHDRFTNIDFQEPSPEINARRYRRIVENAISSPTTVMPSVLEDIELTDEDFMPVVQVIEKLKNAKETADGFIEAPGSRTGQRLWLQIAAGSASGTIAGGSPVMSALKILNYCRSYEHVQAAGDTPIINIIQDQLPALEALSSRIKTAQEMKDRGEKLPKRLIDIKIPTRRDAAKKK